MVHPTLARMINDVHRASEIGAWHAALALTLTLPEICAKASGQRYPEWFDRYVAPAFHVPPRVVGDPSWVAITGHDAYALRNAFHHSGNDDLSVYKRANESFLGRITLTESSRVAGTGVRKLRVPFHDQKAQLVLPVGDLCEQVLDGVTRWALDFAFDREVQSKLEQLVTIKPRSTTPDP
jgi:hypothetical protein